MKKLAVLFLALIVGAAIYFVYDAKIADRQAPVSNDEMVAILSKYDIQLPSEFSVITKEIKNKLYGEWMVVDTTVGYSLKYDITGGHLDDGFLHISQEKYEETMTVFMEPLIDSYPSPVFIYYAETLSEMSKDEILNYSGIEGMDPETVGMVVLGFAFSDYSPNAYDLIPTKFILINDYVIAVRADSFYKLSACVDDNGAVQLSPSPTIEAKPTLPMAINAYGAPHNEYTIFHEDGSFYQIDFVNDGQSNYTMKLFEENGTELQLLALEGCFGRLELDDVNTDGYTDIVVNTGGTFNEIHDLYIWDPETDRFVKVIYEGFEDLVWFSVYDGYIDNFTRGDTPEDSSKEKLVWQGNILIKESDY